MIGSFLQILSVLFLPFAIGAAVVRLAGISLELRRPGWIALALPLGLGLSSLAAFVSLVLADRVLVGLELCLLAGLLLSRRPVALDLAPIPDRRGPFDVGLGIVLGLVSAVSVLAFLGFVRRFPYGDWDAWAFWNTKARAFALGGDTWTWVFSQLVIWWHPEYPVLISASVARGWVLVGSESTLVPIAIAATFTSSSVVLVFWALRRLRGLTPALLGALVLVATPRFVLHGATQYSDVPVGFFMLLAVVCLALYDAEPASRGKLLVLSGLAAGLGAFTKNEGMMFLACLCAARWWVVLKNGGRSAWWREARFFGTGLAAPLFVIVLLKAGYAVRPINSELYPGFSGLAGHVQHQLGDPNRYDGFFASWWHQLTNFDEWTVPVLALLLAYLLLAGLDPDRRRQTTRTVALWLALEVIGISAVFLAWSTLEIRMHMDAVNRLLLQLLPTLTFGVFVSARSPSGFSLGTVGRERAPVVQ